MDKIYSTGPIQNLLIQMSHLEQFRDANRNLYESLTDREVEVLKYVALGMQNQTIAEELEISRNTIQNHRAQLRSKLNIKNQTDFVKYAMAYNLIQL